ncbi:Flp pilus assembly protein CpaB [Solimonas sp. K1W22B-7]|uniref:Flp pilus assembly protein CpaB n=1 Tax=Solimonas sp. K1W22B-7 TaxID=2303331 RepID=UPI000E333208|nr:Flp pilus assembly protein CpaB [Solimonas sp. K1W22B-7]AXQ30769.1 Flp pilus assembly protein CpaB [Solimonas sp. K1W22B-7]
MSSNTLKIVALVAVLLAAVLAVIGYRYSRSFAEKAEQAQKAEAERQQVKQTLAVVAVKPLLAYKPIARDAVALVPVTIVPKDPYTSIDQVVDKVPLIDIDAGAPVTGRYFNESSLLARAIPEGYKAVSVEVTDVIAVGGFIRPGDVVDVMLFLRGGQSINDEQARVLLEGVRVLAYQEQVIDRPEGAEDDPKEKKSRASSRQRTAVLAVADRDITRLMLGASAGELRLALNGVKPDGATATITADSGLPLDDAAAKAAERERSRQISLRQLAKPGTVTPPPEVTPTGPKVQIIRGADSAVIVVQ